MKEYILYPALSDVGKRIDIYLREQLDGLTRNAIQDLIVKQFITIQEISVKKNHRITGKEVLKIQIPDAESVDLVPQNISLDILFEDDDIIVINKARGIVVHPSAGHWDGTLVNALMYHCGQRLSGINGELRPGIVHRIDKDTSGLLVVAKNDMAHQSLAAQIQRHDVSREYQAIVCGNIRDESGTIDKPIARSPSDRKKMAIVENGRPSITHYHVIARYCGYTHLAFQLETGRTHQIRVHTASIGHPIIGDPLYGMKKDPFHAIGGQCLHAYRLSFCHPKTGEPIAFNAPLPHYFQEILAKLKKITD